MKNELAIVTGASKGIGAATARLLGQLGYLVCVNCHQNLELGRAVVNSIVKEGGRAALLPADVGKERDIIKLFKEADKYQEPLKVLVNNAGISGGFHECKDITAKMLSSVFALNVFGVFFCIREAAKRMKANGGGSIVNLSSESAVFGGTKLTHYAASKAAVNAATKGFARELAPFKIRVNAVSPGIIDTDAHKHIPGSRLAMMKATLPMGRMGDASEVANTIAWLLSDNASYVSGSIISVSGAR